MSYLNESVIHSKATRKLTDRHAVRQSISKDLPLLCYLSDSMSHDLPFSSKHCTCPRLAAGMPERHTSALLTSAGSILTMLVLTLPGRALRYCRDSTLPDQSSQFIRWAAGRYCTGAAQLQWTCGAALLGCTLRLIRALNDGMGICRILSGRESLLTLWRYGPA